MAAQDQAVNAVFTAAKKGDVGVVARLLDAHPHLIEEETDRGTTLLIQAAWKGHARLAQLLLRRGANVEHQDDDGCTALHRAAGSGHMEMVLILLRSGARVRKRDFEDGNALRHACRCNHMRVALLLLQHMGKRGLNARDDDWATVLWCCCLWGQPLMVKALLLAGADHTLSNEGGQTPREIAEEIGGSRCAAAAFIEWWEPFILFKARTLHEDTVTRQQTPEAPVPAYVASREAPGDAMPSVDVVAIQQDGQEAQGAASGPPGKRARQAEEEEDEDEECVLVDVIGGDAGIAAHYERVTVGEEEMGAVVGFVAKDLSRELDTELLQGFHFTLRYFEGRDGDFLPSLQAYMEAEERGEDMDEWEEP